MARTIRSLAVWLLVGGLAAFTSPSPLSAAEHTKDSIDTVKKNLAEKKAVLLDVREQKEWDEGRLKDAQLAPLSKLQAGTDVKDLAKDIKKDTIIYCHCRAGRRALTAAELLQKAGYDVRPLKDGYEDLLKAGLPKAP